MAKLTLASIGNILGNPTSAQNTINSNSDLIEDALENTLSRNGTTPNQMQADIDLNDNDLLNVKSIETSSLILDGKLIVPSNPDVTELPAEVMIKPTYDPTGIEDDAFDRANHYGEQPASSVTGLEDFIEANSDRYLIMADFGAVGDGVTNDTVAVTAAIASGRRVDGQGKTYLVTSRPDSFESLTDSLFKVTSIYYPTKDYFRAKTSKITNGLLYTAWAQDKCYLVGTQLRVWVNEKESHPDGTGRIALYFSDDGGTSYSFGEYLALKATGQTLWSAGYDGTSEYLFVRVPAGSTDVAPCTYQLWKRTLGADATQNYNGSWTKTNITFPTPSGFTGQPIMVHSFSVGHSSSIVVGASYGEGAAVMRSTDGGITWTATILGSGSTFEEPTVRYVATSGLYIGFMRYGGDGNPRYWVSSDNLSTVSFWTAPSGYFGVGNLQSSCVSFDIDELGNFHAITAYRNGVIEGAGTDLRTSTFYLTGPVTDSNIWSDPDVRLYSLGQMQRREQGGASALGQGSVVVTPGKIHLYYGVEERTGVIGGYGKGNRVANIYSTVISRDDEGTMFDERVDLADNRSVFSPLRKVSGIDAFVIPTTDASNWSPTLLSGRPNFARSTSTIVLSSDTLTLTGTRFGFYIIDTEGSAATDSLSTIVDADAQEGDVIILATSTSTRDITVKHNVGNILCGADVVLDTAFDKITLMYYNLNWHMIAFANNS